MYRSLFVLALGTFAIGTDGFVIAGILPEVGADLNLSVTAAGQLVTVFALCYAVLSPVLAAATARWSRRTLLLTALTLFVVGNALTAIAPTYPLVLASRVIAAIGAAGYAAAATAAAATLAPPEKRGTALAVVLGGTSVSTALGAPIGTLLATVTTWRGTMWFVAALGLLCFVGVAALLPAIPTLPPVGLAQRLAPLKDKRVATILLGTLLAFVSLYSVYTYISVSFDRATGGSGETLTVLLFAWGVAAVVGNFGAGALTDKFGSRRVLNVSLVVLAVDFALMPFTSAYLVTGIVAVVVWSIAGWALIVPQQHRLIGVNPALAPIVLALNGTALYLAISLSGLVGAAGVSLVGTHNLGLIAAVGLVLALVVAERAHALTRKPATPAPVG
ncbi:MFS transporter [Actinosynnema sp. NPDC020468]|uniref:MFS transporter n=1 Tax=Actinosynnema sp. NPDC020468 TaxID=3154488 RepID=UPI0033DE0688